MRTQALWLISILGIFFNLNAFLYFEQASIKNRDYLINFAVESNDIYKTRTAHRDTAKKIFDISEESFISNMVFILKHNAEILGFFALKPKNAYECELTHLFVKAGLQNKSYGSLLFSKCLETVDSLGFLKLFWISDPDSANFYFKKGSRIIGYDENFLNPKVDVPLFEFDLSKSKT